MAPPNLRERERDFDLKENEEEKLSAVGSDDFDLKSISFLDWIIMSKFPYFEDTSHLLFSCSMIYNECLICFFNQLKKKKGKIDH